MDRGLIQELLKQWIVCADNQADIISLSLGGEGGISIGGITTDQLENAVQDALEQGIFVSRLREMMVVKTMMEMFLPWFCRGCYLCWWSN